ncbi:MAG: 2-amino-4-oxopentanoate thiolase subunit OrtA [bacterium]|nr:2-amino-4-oxopentanoate thiolase subunit OrtA [bacterium]
MIAVWVAIGQWVEIYWVVFDLQSRAEHLPECTKKVPMEAKVKGFALSEAEVGDSLSVKTLSGRIVHGVLSDPNPRHTHSFGEPQIELLRIGVSLREGESDGV